MNKSTEKDTVADVFAGLDAMPDQGADPLRVQPVADVHEMGRALVAAIHERKASKPRELARQALAGITSGAPRVERHRPARGKQRQLAVPVTTQGRLAGELGELTAGRSRRYSRDLESWARAALADHAGRGVLVVWDGINYSISLSRNVERNTVAEVRSEDLRGWLAAVR